MVYLDHAATTPVKPEALQAAWPWLTSEFGNPSSRHELGLRAADALANARIQVANWLGCQPGEIVFTSGASESNNLAIKGIALGLLAPQPERKHIISARTEHESVLQSLDYLERIHGFEIEYLAANRAGQLTAEAVAAAIRPNTALITLMTANNEIGTVHPIAEIAQVARQANVAFHTDAVQAAGWLDINVAQTQVSALSLSGHKIGAPKGVGIAYLSNRLQVEPLIHGGGQEHEMRSGTENVAWAVAFASALNALPNTPDGIDIGSNRVADLRDALVAGVLENVKIAQLTGAPLDEPRQPAIASFVFESINSETLLIELENEGVLCSSGSACAAGKDDPSHVLLALGYEPDLARTSVRLSLGRESTTAEVETALNAIVTACRKITELEGNR